MKKRDNKKTILLIEDNLILIDIYKEAFSCYSDFEIITARQCLKGLKLAKERKPDLILLDILFDDTSQGDGITLLEALRQDPETRNLKVIVFSNYDAKKVVKRSSELGVIDYLVKTHFTPKEFVLLIKNYFEKGRI